MGLYCYYYKTEHLYLKWVGSNDVGRTRMSLGVGVGATTENLWHCGKTGWQAMLLKHQS